MQKPHLQNFGTGRGYHFRHHKRQVVFTAEVGWAQLSCFQWKFHLLAQQSLGLAGYTHNQEIYQKYLMVCQSYFR